MIALRSVALTQRPGRFGDERRLTLDVRWNRFLAACRLIGVPLPLDATLAQDTIRLTGCSGIILTGGDDLAELGGATPERDALERDLIRYSTTEKLPLLGVCRGMQILMATHGVSPALVAGHAGVRHSISGPRRRREVNSYHRWGVREVPDSFVCCARAGDVVEAVRHRWLPQAGIMWHPERDEPFDGGDVDLIAGLFGPRS